MVGRQPSAVGHLSLEDGGREVRREESAEDRGGGSIVGRSIMQELEEDVASGLGQQTTRGVVSPATGVRVECERLTWSGGTDLVD